jgi:hypothetical protein
MADNEVIGSGEFRSTKDPQLGIIRVTKEDGAEVMKPVKYSAINEEAIFEGDIILGNDEQLQKTIEIGDDPLKAIAIIGAGVRWDGGLIPYEIAPDLPDKDRVTDAIAHWEQNTPIRFKVRGDEPDWVVFRPSSGCSSSIGRRGGRQFINLGGRCTTGNAIHEIGHTVGLWHEQSRKDRDKFITIVWTNVENDMKHNFDQHIHDGMDIDSYDYGSIMHYPAHAFAIDPNSPTIVTPDGEDIGQREGLSEMDIAGVLKMYP